MRRRRCGSSDSLRSSILIFSTVSLWALSACGKVTGIDLSIGIDSSLGVDRLSISLAGEDGSPIGEPHHRPETPRLLGEEESLVILLDEGLAGSRITLNVLGESEGTTVAQASAEVSISSKVLVSVRIELSEEAYCSSDAQCEGLVCELGECVSGCRIDSVFVPAGETKTGDPCSICAPEVSVSEWTAADEGTVCGTDLLCDANGDCVPTDEEDVSLTVVIAGDGSGAVEDTDGFISCSSSGGVPCAASFEVGSTVRLTASADVDSYFAGWDGGDCSGTGALCEVSMTADTVVTATFAVSTQPACRTPWETYISVGESVVAYRKEVDHCCPSDADCCESRVRTCQSDSTLSDHDDFSEQHCDISTDVGDRCSDGSVYAGWFQNSHYYAAAEDLRTIAGCDGGQELCGAQLVACHTNELRWDCPPTGEHHTDTGATSTSDGQWNTAELVGIDYVTRHRAAARCNAYDPTGRADYFLPALTELQHLYTHRAVIGGFRTQNCTGPDGGSNASCSYWSSTESQMDPDLAASVSFSTGPQSQSSSKLHTFFVRCVRKDEM